MVSWLWSSVVVMTLVSTTWAKQHHNISQAITATSNSLNTLLISQHNTILPLPILNTNYLHRDEGTMVSFGDEESIPAIASSKINRLDPIPSSQITGIDSIPHLPTSQSTKVNPSSSASSSSQTTGVNAFNSQEILQNLEKSLLSFFGLPKRPNVRKGSQIPSFMMDLYKRQKRAVVMSHHDSIINSNSSEMEQEKISIEENVLTNSVRSFTHTEVRSTVKKSISEVHLYFNVSSIPDSELLQNAELRLVHRSHDSGPSIEDTVFINDKSHKKQRHWTRKEEIYLQRVTVFDVVRPVRKGAPDPVLRILDTCLVDTRSSGSFTLDVSPAVKRWHRNPKLNYGLVVEVKPYNNKHRLSQQRKSNHIRLRRDVSSPDRWREEQPFLLTYSDDDRIKQRVKRSKKIYSHMKIRQHCQKYKMFVDFRSVGWNDWIVAPPGYEAFYCKGDCPYPLADHLDPTNHAVVQNLVHSTYPDRVPKACCVPTELSPISMLYLDEDDRVVLKNYQDMVVEKCGCR